MGQQSAQNGGEIDDLTTRLARRLQSSLPTVTALTTNAKASEWELERYLSAY